MPTKKKFIDKKNSVTFVLGHRSQKDPLITDENAPQRVLIPIDQAQVPGTSSGPRPNKEGNIKDAAKRKEEQAQYGIYFDDEYDYLQHLKDSKEVSNIEWDICERINAIEKKPVASKADLKDIKLVLPSSVFGSEYQEDIGLLNKAAPTHGPRPDLDPDVIAALEDDFDFEDPSNELEDNFMELATGGDMLKEGEPTPDDLEGLFSDGDEDGEEDDEYTDEMDEDADSLGSLKGPQHTFADEETKSHFTNYSMTSSVVRRNNLLTLVDDKFEKMYEDYEDTEIGALDCDEIEGHLDPESEMLMKVAEEFEEDRKKEAALYDKITNLVIKQDESDSNDGSLTESDEEMEKEKWDCESIISTYSTTRNRPKIIKEASKNNKIRVSSKTGMPVGVLGKGLTKSKLKDLDQEYNEQHGFQSLKQEKTLISGVSSVRNKDETPEERLQRKKIVKEFRKERRLERKANTDAFKEEKKRQEKVRLNAKVNVQGLKL